MKKNEKKYEIMFDEKKYEKFGNIPAKFSKFLYIFIFFYT